MVAAAVLLNVANLDVWLALITAIVLVLVTVPMLRWVAHRDGDPAIFGVLVGGLIAKLCFSMVRYFFVEVVYRGEADGGGTEVGEGACVDVDGGAARLAAVRVAAAGHRQAMPTGK